MPDRDPPVVPHTKSGLFQLGQRLKQDTVGLLSLVDFVEFLLQTTQGVVAVERLQLAAFDGASSTNGFFCPSTLNILPIVRWHAIQQHLGDSLAVFPPGGASASWSNL